MSRVKSQARMNQSQECTVVSKLKLQDKKAIAVVRDEELRVSYIWRWVGTSQACAKEWQTNAIMGVSAFLFLEDGHPIAFCHSLFTLKLLDHHHNSCCPCFKLALEPQGTNVTIHSNKVWAQKLVLHTCTCTSDDSHQVHEAYSIYVQRERKRAYSKRQA